ncbi:MAG: hypothetical protein NC081_06125, partial [Roseburia sp.]|nr:hypothetical protein [Roseburia sp.]
GELQNMIGNKDKVIQKKQKIIDRLLAENNKLREQLKELNPDILAEKMKLAADSYDEYKKLAGELAAAKKEYLEIIRDARRYRKELETIKCRKK